MNHSAKDLSLLRFFKSVPENISFTQKTKNNDGFFNSKNLTAIVTSVIFLRMVLQEQGTSRSPRQLALKAHRTHVEENRQQLLDHLHHHNVLTSIGLVFRHTALGLHHQVHCEIET